jgi:hypothetical protein
VLLGALPFTGLGPEACLTIATALAVAAIVLAERRQGRREAEGRRPRRRRAMGALAAAGLTLAAVAVLAYAIFVIRAA